MLSSYTFTLTLYSIPEANSAEVRFWVRTFPPTATLTEKAAVWGTTIKRYCVSETFKA